MSISSLLSFFGIGKQESKASSSSKTNGSGEVKTKKIDQNKSGTSTVQKKGTTNGEKEENKSVETSFDQLKKTKYGDYTYTANGEETYGEIKERLGLDRGVLRERNPELFKKIDGNADYATPEKGTKIKLLAKDLPMKPANFKSDSGKALSGFYKNDDGDLYYEVESGDTQVSIYKKLNNECFKKYRTAEALRGCPQETLQIGTKIKIEEKSWFEKLFSWSW